VNKDGAVYNSSIKEARGHPDRIDEVGLRRGKVVEGLVRRREAEIALWNGKDLTIS
jgi:GH24 family phage-related lysozyme (muramidase)